MYEHLFLVDTALNKLDVGWASLHVPTYSHHVCLTNLVLHLNRAITSAVHAHSIILVRLQWYGKDFSIQMVSYLLHTYMDHQL